MRIDKYPNKPKTGWKPAWSVNFRGSRKPAEGKKCGCGEAVAASQPVSFSEAASQPEGKNAAKPSRQPAGKYLG